jgi:hypothetical protein
MSDVHCQTCRFLCYAGQTIGALAAVTLTTQNKHEMDWCGEHIQQTIKMVSLPVYDITTDETKVAEMPVERKKPGRKPKNANSPAA